MFVGLGYTSIDCASLAEDVFVLGHDGLVAVDEISISFDAELGAAVRHAAQCDDKALPPSLSYLRRPAPVAATRE